ncbi:MAG TPA: hypothetical protein VF743_09580 [Acidimicrobiales bacterium]
MARLQLDIAVDRSATGGPGDGSDPPVRGTVVHADGTEATFVGWVGLLALLQRAVS